MLTGACCPVPPPRSQSPLAVLPHDMAPARCSALAAPQLAHCAPVPVAASEGVDDDGDVDERGVDHRDGIADDRPRPLLRPLLRPRRQAPPRQGAGHRPRPSPFPPPPRFACVYINRAGAPWSPPTPLNGRKPSSTGPAIELRLEPSLHVRKQELFAWHTLPLPRYYARRSTWPLTRACDGAHNSSNISIPSPPPTRRRQAERLDTYRRAR